MMKRLKIVLALVLVMMVLTGCSAGNDQSMNFVDIGDLTGGSLPEIPPINFGGSDIISSTSYSSLDDSSIGNSFPVEEKPNATEINVPNALQYNICTAEYTDYDSEKVKSVLLGDIDVAPEITYNRSGNPIYFWKNDDLTLIVNSGSAMVSLTGDLMSMIEILFSRPNDRSNGNIDLYEHRNENLDFCTREDAIKDVKKKLEEIGVGVYEKADVYTLNQSDLQKVANKACADGTFYDFRSNSKGEEKLLDSYTVEKSEECYYIVFNAEYNGIPIYDNPFSYQTLKDVTMFHPQIYAIYSVDGLVGLRVSNYRGTISMNENVTQLISTESASQLVATKYAEVVGIDQIAFDKLELMYVFTPNSIDGKINVLKAKMIPAWVCTIEIRQQGYDRTTGQNGLITSKATILIDAYSGVEII